MSTCASCITESDPDYATRYDVFTACFNGELCGYCEDEHCGGTCSPVGPCDCPCHAT